MGGAGSTTGNKKYRILKGAVIVLYSTQIQIILENILRQIGYEDLKCSDVTRDKLASARFCDHDNDDQPVDDENLGSGKAAISFYYATFSQRWL